MSKTNTFGKLTGSIILVVILTICLCIASYALIYATVGVENNLFSTGKVDINLNDGMPVIREHEFLFEPGMTVKKDFFLENSSTSPVYYRLYLDNVEGGLADVLEIDIKDGDTVLYSGTAASLNRTNPGNEVEKILEIGEKKILSIYFHYPNDKANDTQNLTLTFDMCADAVQTKNNPGQAFD